MMRRVTFTSLGISPCQQLCEALLIENGYEYMPWSHVESVDFAVDFILVGTTGDLPETCCHTPTIILSSGQVYSCLNSNGEVKLEPFLEHRPIVIPSTLGLNGQARSIGGEAYCRDTFPDHAVLRLFDVYGPGAAYGWVNFYFEQLKAKAPLLVQHSPQRRISCLFVDDFKDAFLLFVWKFLWDQVRGLYNIGSDQEITFSHLADTVYQAWSGSRDKAPIQLESVESHVNFYEVPDITRIKALLKWSPKVTLRKGTWMTMQELK